MYLNLSVWHIIIFAYILIASVTPVWALLQQMCIRDRPESPHPASPRTIVPARTSVAKILDLFFIIIPPFVSALKR